MSRIILITALVAISLHGIVAQITTQLSCANPGNKASCAYTTSNVTWDSKFSSTKGKVGHLLSGYYQTNQVLCLTVEWKQNSELKNGTEYFRIQTEALDPRDSSEVYASYSKFQDDLHNKAGSK